MKEEHKFYPIGRVERQYALVITGVIVAIFLFIGAVAMVVKVLRALDPPQPEQWQQVKSRR